MRNQIGAVAIALTLSACAASFELDGARASVGLLRTPKSATAAADQLLADQSILAVAGGDPVKAVAALQAMGVTVRDAQRRILAAQAAATTK